MINITHSLGGINLILLLMNLGLFFIGDASIWFILLSIFLGQIMDLDHKGAGISKKFGLQSLSKVIIFFTSGHRKETHSIFYSLLIAFLLFPLNIFVSILDGSSLMGNFMVAFFAILSHGILDMANKEPIPLFYIPIINPLEKAKEYTYSNFLNNILTNFGIKTDKFIFKNFGLAVSSEKEFKFVTVPLIALFFILIGINLENIIEKVNQGSTLIIEHPIIGFILLIFSIYGNYLFKETGGFSSFIYNVLKNPGNFSYRNIGDLKKIFWEGNFTKILTFLLILFSIGLNPEEYLTNLLNSFFDTYEYLHFQLFENPESLIDRTLEILNRFIF